MLAHKSSTAIICWPDSIGLIISIMLTNAGTKATADANLDGLNVLGSSFVTPFGRRC